MIDLFRDPNRGGPVRDLLRDYGVNTASIDKVLSEKVGRSVLPFSWDDIVRGMSERQSKSLRLEQITQAQVAPGRGELIPPGYTQTRYGLGQLVGSVPLRIPGVKRLLLSGESNVAPTPRRPFRVPTPPPIPPKAEKPPSAPTENTGLLATWKPSGAGDVTPPPRGASSVQYVKGQRLAWRENAGKWVAEEIEQPKPQEIAKPEAQTAKKPPELLGLDYEDAVMVKKIDKAISQMNRGVIPEDPKIKTFLKGMKIGPEMRAKLLAERVALLQKKGRTPAAAFLHKEIPPAALSKPRATLEAKEASKGKTAAKVPKPTKAEKSIRPTPDRVFLIGRGVHGQVRVVFPDKAHADLYADAGRGIARLGGKNPAPNAGVPSPVEQLKAKFGFASSVDLLDASNRYREQVHRAIKSLEEGSEYQAPPFEVKAKVETPAPKAKLAKPTKAAAKEAKVEAEIKKGEADLKKAMGSERRAEQLAREGKSPDQIGAALMKEAVERGEVPTLSTEIVRARLLNLNLNDQVGSVARIQKEIKVGYGRAKSIFDTLKKEGKK